MEKSIFKSKLFIFVLIIKLISMFIFASNYFLNNAVFFVRYFFDSGLNNPYEIFYTVSGFEFPYSGGMLFLLALPIAILFNVFNLNYLYLFGLKLPILLADIVIYYYLCKLLKDKTRLVQIFYWCSPIAFFINYYNSWFDVIPIAFLLASIYYLINNKHILSVALFGLSLSTKIGIFVIAPLFFAYLLKQKTRFHHVLKYFFLSVFIYFLINLPFLFSKGFFELAFSTSKQHGLLSLSVPISTSFQFFLLPAVYIVLILYIFSFRRINKEMLLMFVALVFIVLVSLMPPLPNWYYWLLPFLIYFFIKEKKVHAISYWAFNVFYLGYFIFWKDLNVFNSLQFLSKDLALKQAPYYFVSSFGFNPDILLNVLFTLLTSSLALSAYWVYKYGVRSNLYYKDRDKPLLIGVAGDSGVGKTTISDILQDLVGKNFTTLVSGDDMHKWERGDKNWKYFTHLNPFSNYLQREVSNLQNLKSEGDIKRRLYDHNTGKFTEPKIIQSNKFIIFEGLHSFYVNVVRNMCDIKIFLRTDENLRRHWKILRDMANRSHTKEKILKSIKSREKDAMKHVLPQSKFADIIVSFSTKNKIRNLGSNEKIDLILNITVENSFDVNPLIDVLSVINTLKINYFPGDDLTTHTLVFDGLISSDLVNGCAYKLVPNYEDIILNRSIKWDDNYNGLIQLMFLCYLSYKLKREMLNV